MATEKTITIDLASKKVTMSTAVVALRETVTIALVNTGAATAADVILAVGDRGNVIVETQNFTSGSGQFDGSIDLDDAGLAAFFVGKSGQKTRQFDLMLWDTGRDKLLINDRIKIMNNPYLKDMPLPTEL